MNQITLNRDCLIKALEVVLASKVLGRGVLIDTAQKNFKLVVASESLMVSTEIKHNSPSGEFVLNSVLSKGSVKLLLKFLKTLNVDTLGVCVDSKFSILVSDELVYDDFFTGDNFPDYKLVECTEDFGHFIDSLKCVLQSFIPKKIFPVRIDDFCPIESHSEFKNGLTRFTRRYESELLTINVTTPLN